MYNIPEDEIMDYLATVKAKDPRSAFLTNQINDYKVPKNFMNSNDINPENIPDGMVYGEVEYYNSTQGVLYENVEAHRAQGWEDVYIYNHPELTQLSRESREKKARSNRSRRHNSEYYDFDPDEVLIKRKGVMMMQKDAAAQRQYEYNLHQVSRAQKLKSTEEGFNANQNDFGMKLSIVRDMQETLRNDEQSQVFDYNV